MHKNVVILTFGIAGSSVLTNLISKAGYWSGAETIKKKDYDTHENRDLVALNERLLKVSGIENEYVKKFDNDYIERISSLSDKLDETPFANFLSNCEQHRPWIWKDPRLWLTMYFWQKFWDFESTKFIIITREPLQNWISTIIRRQIASYSYLQNYNAQVMNSIETFLKNKNAEYLALTFEDIVCRPESTLVRLNKLLGTKLTMNDLSDVYNKPLYKRAHGPLNFGKAALIFLKNFNQRWR